MKKVVVILLTLISLYSNAQVVDKVTSIEDQNIATIETKDPCSEIDRIMNASFECDTVFDCGTDSVTYGGQVYHTVQIGDQCWFKENLNIGTKQNIDYEYPNLNYQSYSGSVTKFCYNNDAGKCSSRGGLYQFWNAIRHAPGFYQGTTFDGSQGICPSGWRVPSKTDFDALVIYLDNMNYDGGTLKKEGEWDGDYDANNITGFSAIPTGSFCNDYSTAILCDSDMFMGLNEFTVFMTTTIENNTSDPYNQNFYGRMLNTMFPNFYKAGTDFSTFKYVSGGGYGGGGYSIRCLKD